MKFLSGIMILAALSGVTANAAWAQSPTTDSSAPATVKLSVRAVTTLATGCHKDPQTGRWNCPNPVVFGAPGGGSPGGGHPGTNLRAVDLAAQVSIAALVGGNGGRATH